MDGRKSWTVARGGGPLDVCDPPRRTLRRALRPRTCRIYRRGVYDLCPTLRRHDRRTVGSEVSYPVSSLLHPSRSILSLSKTLLSWTVTRGRRAPVGLLRLDIGILYGTPSVLTSGSRSAGPVAVGGQSGRKRG